MTTARATICNKKGLHARAAAKLVNLAVTFQAAVTVTRLHSDGTAAGSAGATSILSLLMLAADKGSEVEIVATGAQGEEAVTAILALITNRFGEDE